VELMPGYKSPWMTEELELVRDAANKFFMREFVPHTERWIKQHHIDRDAWRKVGAAGFLCASIPEAYGGGGGTFAHDMVIVEEQERTLAVGLGNVVHSGIVAHYINSYGSEDQKLKWLPKMASGDVVGAIAMTEPGTGSDLQGVRTTARKSDKGYIINGSKTFITNGYLADLIVVVARTGGEGGKGLSLIVVETENAPGFRRGRNLEKLGQHAQDTAELFFDNVPVPLENLLGPEEGQGFAQLMSQLPQERLLIAAQACAIMEVAIGLTADYVKERKAFGKRILDFQNTAFRMAECKTEAHIARVFIDDCTVRHQKGELDATTAAMAKYWSTDKQCEIIDTCLQFFGGYGYMMEYPIARLYADARIQRIYGGTNEIMKLLIARTL
jgi:acyl-CoA dehydrogenase